MQKNFKFKIGQIILKMKKITKLYLYANRKQFMHIKHNITIINFLLRDKLITNLYLYFNTII
jgi:hypothetical protein